jgi:hypothetical protein
MSFTLNNKISICQININMYVTSIHIIVQSIRANIDQIKSKPGGNICKIYALDILSLCDGKLSYLISNYWGVKLQKNSAKRPLVPTAAYAINRSFCRWIITKHAITVIIIKF